jgi:GDPmannose 4,6-dehydratase
MKKKIALVTGSAGQDGSYLCEFLLKKNYKVIAGDRRSSRNDNWRHNYLNIVPKIIYEDFDLADIDSIHRLLKKYKFNEIYNLAAQSFVQTSFTTPISTSNVTGLGVLRILEIIRCISPKTKFYQASSSEMYGDTKSKNQNEITNFNPRSPYAIAKVFGHHVTKNYRESYNIFACSGILFNHESPLRGEEFVTRKITKQLTEIKLKKRKCLELGNLYARRDWGYAKDYVEAMWKMLQQKKADDYVVSTGKTYSIKYFVNKCCRYLGIKIKWKGKGINEHAINLNNNKIIIKINKKYFRPAEVNYLKGNYLKAKKQLKWRPKTNIDQLIKIMINSELKKNY